MPQPVPLRPKSNGAPKHFARTEAELFAKIIIRAYGLHGEVSQKILEEPPAHDGLAKSERLSGAWRAALSR